LAPKLSYVTHHPDNQYSIQLVTLKLCQLYMPATQR